MKPTIHRLKNKIPVILVPQAGVASMTFMVFVKVGSRYETEEINGASHFIEHLMFKGTRRRPTTLMISKELDRYGAEYNASTGKDLTSYYVKMDAAHTPLAIDLLHDMLFHSKFDAAEIQRERGVIIEEIKMYEDHPSSHLFDLLEQTLYPSSTLGWEITGPREVIRSVSREALCAYRDRYYIPSRLSLVLAGKIHPRALSLLQKTFGQVRVPAHPDDATFAPFVPPPSLKHALAFQSKKIEQVQLGLAFHGLPYGHAQMPAMRLLSTILGGSMSSRLFTEVRERRGLCYSIQAGHQSFEDTGMFSISSGLDHERVHEAASAIWRELKRLCDTPVSADELRRAKDHLRGHWTLALEDSSHQADWYGRQWVFQSGLQTPEERVRIMERVQPKELRELARKLFDPTAMALSVIGPYPRRAQVEKDLAALLTLEQKRKTA